MAEIASISGIAVGDIASISGITVENIATINGVDWPAGAEISPTWSYGESRYFVSAGSTIIPRWSYGESEVIHDGT